MEIFSKNLENLKKGDFTFSVIVILLLLAPLMLVPFSTQSEFENRNLMTIDEALDSNYEEITNNLNVALSDNLPFRQVIIGGMNDFAYRHLSSTFQDNVIVGSSDWLFYNTNPVIATYTRRSPMGNTTIELWKDKLGKEKKLVEAFNAQYFITIPPNKSTIYPDELPLFAYQNFNNEKRLDQFQKIAFESDINFIDLRPSLREGTSNYLTYHTYDTHWTRYGAFLGYENLLYSFSEKYSPIEVEWSEKNETNGDLTRILAIDNLEPIKKNPIPSFQVSSKIDGTLGERNGLVISKNENAPIKKNLLITHDSYGLSMNPFLFETFEEVVAIYKFNQKLDAELLEKYKPDYVVRLFVERRLASNSPVLD